jgi:hypothetical protein
MAPDPSAVAFSLPGTGLLSARPRAAVSKRSQRGHRHQTVPTVAPSANGGDGGAVTKRWQRRSDVLGLGESG